MEGMMLVNIVIGLAAWALASVVVGVVLGRVMAFGEDRDLAMRDSEEPPLRKAA